jgi:hypothetical protein
MACDRRVAQARRFGQGHPSYNPRRPPAPNKTLRVGLVVHNDSRVEVCLSVPGGSSRWQTCSRQYKACAEEPDSEYPLVQPENGPFIGVACGHLCCLPARDRGIAYDSPQFGHMHALEDYHRGYCLVAEAQVRLEACASFASELQKEPVYATELRAIRDLLVADVRLQALLQTLAGAALAGDARVSAASRAPPASQRCAGTPRRVLSLRARPRDACLARLQPAQAVSSLARALPLKVRCNFWLWQSPKSYKFRERKMEPTDDDFKCSKLASHAAREYLKQVIRWDKPVTLKNKFRPPYIPQERVHRPDAARRKARPLG